MTINRVIATNGSLMLLELENSMYACVDTENGSVGISLYSDTFTKAGYFVPAKNAKVPNGCSELVNKFCNSKTGRELVKLLKEMGKTSL